MLNIHRDHFIANPISSDNLFKLSVSSVEIEISSFCNRKCGFCPNSYIDRRTNQKIMEDALFYNIINHLKLINYDKDIRLHRYNEPLVDRSYIIRRLQECRAALPKAIITIFSNGDYLTNDYVQALRLAGCNCLKIGIYLGEQARYTDASMLERMECRLCDWGYPFVFTSRKPGFFQATVDAGPGLDFIVTGQNFNRLNENSGDVVAMDRGGALDVGKLHRRISPCIIPFTDLQVEYDGTLVPCCNLRSDVPAHHSGILGRLGVDDDLFAAWTNAAYVQWRRSLIVWGQKKSPCATCDHVLFEDTPATRGMINGIIRSIPELAS